MRYILFALLVVLVGCNSQPETYFHLQGEAQGTTFSIKYHGETATDLSKEIEQLLIDIDSSMSLWVEDSEISKFNSNRDSLVNIIDPKGHFRTVFGLSKSVYKETKGAFDPTINPVVEYWGFGAKGTDFVENDSLLSIALSKVSFKDDDVSIKEFDLQGAKIKKRPDTQLNFNSIAQGYAVDAVGVLLQINGIENYLIEIGGEALTRGVNTNEEVWKIGIDKPQIKSEIKEAVSLENQAIATSGSYRKFKEINGKKYSHAIDPKTGLPVTHNLLSATVIADQCAIADAYATAFLVMGTNKTIDFVMSNPQLKLEVYLIYDEEGELKTFSTPGFGAEELVM